MHEPFHFETPSQIQARLKAEREAARDAAGYGSGPLSNALYNVQTDEGDTGIERVGNALRRAVTGQQFVGGRANIGKTVDSLKERGFSDTEIKNFFKDVDADPEEYGISGNILNNPNELNRYLMAYVDESSKLYQQTLDTEREMKREEADARLQRDYDKAVLESSQQTTEEAGLVAERKREQQKSKEYVQSKGGTSMREARKGSAVMIPQRRPM
tara:strand:- start:786 stop:1427 length:642 start_codon:yes stop_codon:yes gene_type:complete